MAVVEDLLRPVSPLPEEVEESLLREAALKSIFTKKDEIIKQINKTKEQMLLSGAVKEVGTQVEAGDMSRETLLGAENPYSNYIKSLERRCQSLSPFVVTARPRSNRTVSLKTNGELTIVINNQQEGVIGGEH